MKTDRNTQAKKLMKVLKYGSLTSFDYKDNPEEFEVYKEIPGFVNKIVVKWNPYNPDLVDFLNVQQLTDNPYTLIDLIYHVELNNIAE